MLAGAGIRVGLGVPGGIEHDELGAVVIEAYGGSTVMKVPDSQSLCP
jgi:hypothetical protein